MLFSGVRNGQPYNNLCERCIGNLGSSEFFRRWDRQNQRRTFAADIVQPSDDDFAKVYGHEKARQYGWTDEQLRKLG